MPRISEFFGIVIRMYYDDHGQAHFHAASAGREAIVGIDPLVVLEGRLTPRELGLVVEWASRHQEELRDNWDRAQRHETLVRIPPLE